MINAKIQEALNNQINAELYSAYLYLSMQAYFESTNLPGFANWMIAQTQEELAHAMKIYDFVNERGSNVFLKAIPQPKSEWKSPLDVFSDVQKHEEKVTGLINDLVNLAIEQKDHATNSFLMWFVNEQIEEEKSAGDVLEKLKLIDDDTQGLFMLDNQMAQRTFTATDKTEGEK